MPPLEIGMHMSNYAGRVAHDDMAWREGSALDQATLPSYSEQGQVLIMKGIFERTLSKKAPAGVKGSHKNRDCGEFSGSRRWGRIIREVCQKAYYPYLKEGTVK